ncbi:MAG: arsenate reductase (glutaredoxin) [Dongiaceae bacterium]
MPKPTPDVIIYHNPACGTSRSTLAMIREAGIEPRIVEYLKAPPERDELAEIIQKSGLTVREAIREKSPAYAELKLDNPKLSADKLLDAMVANPELINRPFVVTPQGMRLCRPAERVKEILPGGSRSER